MVWSDFYHSKKAESRVIARIGLGFRRTSHQGPFLRVSTTVMFRSFLR